MPDLSAPLKWTHAQLADVFKASLTGHWVLPTLHAHSAAATLTHQIGMSMNWFLGADPIQFG